MCSPQQQSVQKRVHSSEDIPRLGRVQVDDQLQQHLMQRRIVDHMLNDWLWRQEAMLSRCSIACNAAMHPSLNARLQPKAFFGG